MEKFSNFHRSLVGWDEDREEDFLGESNGSCSLSPLQRIYGFAACLVAGLACLLLRVYGFAACLVAGLACLLLSLIIFYKPIKFAVMFSFGNLLAVGSTVFLIGPGQQARMMLDPVRIYATAIYIGSVVLALVCALWIHNKIFTLIAIISEICALIWYSLSYVPFARRMVSELLISCCDTEI